MRCSIRRVGVLTGQKPGAVLGALGRRAEIELGEFTDGDSRHVVPLALLAEPPVPPEPPVQAVAVELAVVVVPPPAPVVPVSPVEHAATPVAATQRTTVV